MTETGGVNTSKLSIDSGVTQSRGEYQRTKSSSTHPSFSALNDSISKYEKKQKEINE